MASTSKRSPYSDQVQSLQRYTACDVADALLKLRVPNAGYLSDLTLQTTAKTKNSSSGIPIIAPVSTVTFASKDGSGQAGLPDANIPPGKHWVDLTEPETIVVMAQPKGQKCAVLGGIMALRMQVLGAKGIVVCGRVRDVDELNETGLPIWSQSTSIVGAGAESKPHAIQVPLNIDGTVITPGDLIFSDATNGVVVIPQDKVSDVVKLLPDLVSADDRVKRDVSKGMTVQEAFKKHRGQ